MSKSIAIIGDRFMLPSIFADRIAAACGDGVDIRTLEQPWPDEPMEHGYAGSSLDRLKEYMGDPDEIAAFIGDAPVFVTHLAPISRAMLERLPNLKFIAVSRGGPVNVDMEAARDHDVLVVNTPGRNASAVAADIASAKDFTTKALGTRKANEEKKNAGPGGITMDSSGNLK